MAGRARARRRLSAAHLVGAAALALLTGCGGQATQAGNGGVENGTAAQDAAPDPAADPVSPEAADTLRLGLTEWSIEASASQLRPGTVTVVVTNTGGTGHDVVLTGQAGRWATPVLAPGERYELEITATPGEELELVCTVTGHHSAGMWTTLPVADEDR